MPKGLHQDDYLQISALEIADKILYLLPRVSFRWRHALQKTREWEHILELEHEARDEEFEASDHKLDILDQKIEE